MGDVNALAVAIEEVLALEAKPQEVAMYAEAFAPWVTAQAMAELLRNRDKWRATSDETVGHTAAGR